MLRLFFLVISTILSFCGILRFTLFLYANDLWWDPEFDNHDQNYSLKLLLFVCLSLFKLFCFICNIASYDSFLRTWNVPQVALTCMAKLRDERFMFPGNLSSDSITCLDLIVVKQLSNGACVTILFKLIMAILRNESSEALRRRYVTHSVIVSDCVAVHCLAG